MGDIQYAWVQGLYLQLLIKFEHSHYYKSELLIHLSAVEYRLLEHDSDTTSPKRGEQKFYLHYGYSFDNRLYCKTINFIETKIPAIKMKANFFIIGFHLHI